MRQYTQRLKRGSISHEEVMENLETLSDDYFCFMGDGEIFVRLKKVKAASQALPT